MAKAANPHPVRLICGMISARAALFDEASREMEAVFSPVDLKSELLPFDFTHYYDQEMGSPLWRQFVSFSRLVSPDALAEAKRATNRLEELFAGRHAAAGQPPRPINLDVGYVDESKLILASMKNFSHRIYLSGGVYAELTLMYHKGLWDALNWTFPDFASPRYHGFLTQVRCKLREHLVQCRSHSENQT